MSDEKKLPTGAETEKAESLDLQKLNRLELSSDIDKLGKQKDSLIVLRDYLESTLLKFRRDDPNLDIGKLTPQEAISKAKKIADLSPEEKKAVELLGKALEIKWGILKNHVAQFQWQAILDRTKNKPILPKEGIEAAAEMPPDMKKLKDAADKIGRDPNAPYAATMAAIEPLKPLERQEEGVAFLDFQLSRILIQIIHKNPKTDIKSMRLNQLSGIVRNLSSPSTPQENRLIIDAHEAVALAKVDELLLNPASPINQQLNLLWPSILEKADGTREGLWGKYKKQFEKEPAKTIALTLAGGVGIYLGLKTLKWLAGKAWDETKKSAKDKVDSLFSLKSILGITALTGLAGYMGRNKIQSWVYEKFGLRLADKDVNAIVDQLKDGKMPPQLEQAGAALQDAQKAAGVAVGAGKEAITAVAEHAEDDDGFLAAFGIKKEKPEKLAEFNGYSTFIKDKTKLEVDSKLFSYLYNKDYEEFLKQAPSFLDRVFTGITIFDDIKKKKLPQEQLVNFFDNYKARNLVDFFQKMVKNSGRHDEFKGKTIAEVMKLIKNNPDEYLDPKATKEATAKNVHFQNFTTLLNQLKDNRDLINNRDFQAHLIAEATQGGATIVLDNMAHMAYWVADNGMAGAMVEAELVYKTLHIIADKAMESESNWLWGLGAYLHVGAYSAAIGAPIGAVTGIGRTLMNTKSWTWALLRGGVIGSLEGAYKGAMFPIEALKTSGSMAWAYKMRGIKPADQLRGALDMQMFLFEDLSLGPVGRDIMGMKSLPDKILDGQVKVDKRLMQRLETYMNQLDSQREHYRVLAKDNPVKSKIYTDIKQTYERSLEQTKKILETFGWSKQEMHDTAHLQELRKLLGQKGIAQDVIENAVKGNGRLEILLLNEKHPFTQFILKGGNGEKASCLLSAIKQNGKLLDGFTSSPTLIEDAEMLRAIDKLDLKDLSSFEKAFAERLAAAEKTEQGIVRRLAGKAAEKTGEAIRGVRAIKVNGTTVEALAKASDPMEVQNILEKEGLKLGDYTRDLLAKANTTDDVKYVIEEAAKADGKYVKFVEAAGKGAKVLRVVKPVFQSAFGAAAFMGAGFDFYNAAESENKEARNLYLQKGGIDTVAGGIDVGLMVGGAGLGTMTAYTAAAAPYLYMIESGYQSSIEAETTSKQWAQRYNHSDLFHEWISTNPVELSAGESYRAALTSTNLDQIREEHFKTAGEIAKALLLQEGERFADEGKYRFDYLMKTCRAMPPIDYEGARLLLHKSRIYAEVANKREEARKQGITELAVGDQNLLDAAYDPAKIDAGTMENLVSLYQKDCESRIALGKNFETVPTGKLIDYLYQLDKYLEDPDSKPNLAQGEVTFRDELRNYLFYARKVDPQRALQEKYLKATDELILAERKQLPKDPKELVEARRSAFERVKKDYSKTLVLAEMNRFENGERTEMEAKKEGTTDTDACFALTKLAEYFGYTGLQNEKELKQFFVEDRKAAFGIYWHDGNWYVSRPGFKFDDKIGPNLDRSTVTRIVARLREKSEDILGHRQDAITSSMTDLFKPEVQRMAKVLEDGLSGYRKKAPQEEKPKPMPVAVEEKEPEAIAA